MVQIRRSDTTPMSRRTGRFLATRVSPIPIRPHLTAHRPSVLAVTRDS
jgi:hypothetical protein